MDFENNIKDGKITVYADSKIYNKDSILKCLYWFGEKFHSNISIENNFYYKIVIYPLSTAKIIDEDLELYQQKLERDLIDYSLRDIVTKETQNIRDLLIAKAFSHGEFDEDPPGEVSDSVGFNPSLV